MSPWLFSTAVFAQESPPSETSSEGNANGDATSTSTSNSPKTKVESGSPSQAQLDALEARLLGEVPTDVAVNGSYESNEMSGILWILPVFLFMVLIIAWSRFRKAAPINPGEVRVLSKTPLGKEGSLAVIVVGESDGAEQKMLVGLSENSAPRLLSVLDAQWNREAVSPSETGNFDAFLDNVSPIATSTAQANNATNSTARNPAESTTQTKGTERRVPEPHLEARQDLVEELLTERGIQQYQKVASLDQEARAQQTPSFDFGDEEDSVVDDDPWVVNFRRKYQQS